MEMDETIGAINWIDLTVLDTDGIRDFYKNVVRLKG
jgi:predicted enzyme related to lactoylglutathione lyase